MSMRYAETRGAGGKTNGSAVERGTWDLEYPPSSRVSLYVSKHPFRRCHAALTALTFTDSPADTNRMDKNLATFDKFTQIMERLSQAQRSWRIVMWEYRSTVLL